MTSENQNPPSGEQQAARKSAETPTKISHTATELKPPPPNPECKNACKEQKHWLDYVTFGMELLGLIVLCVYAGYTIRIYCANQKAADAAKSAADTARDTLVKGNRPWVGIDGFPQIKEPVTISTENGQERADFVVLLVIKNFGTAPALHMKVDMRNFDNKTTNSAEWLTLQKSFIDDSCKSAETRMHPPKSNAVDSNGHQIAVPESDSGPYVFPGTPGLAHEWHMGLPSLNDRSGELRLIGCIAYTDQFKIVHHSTFCFRNNDGVKKAGPDTRFAICDMNQYAD